MGYFHQIRPLRGDGEAGGANTRAAARSQPPLANFSPAANVPAPMFKLADAPTERNARIGETEWMRNKVGKSTTVSLLVSGGDMGAKEIGKLIKLLEAQQAVLDDDEDDDA
jgi:hypothetical protein